MGVVSYIKGKIGRLRGKPSPEQMQQEQIKQLVGLVGQYPETNLLLQLANKDNIGIAFDPSLAERRVGGALHTTEKGQQYIALAPSDDMGFLAYNLIHELRHVWQNKVLGLTPQTMNKTDTDPETALILTRVREADAHAFAKLVFRRMQAAQSDEADVQKLFAKLSESTGKAPDDFQAQMITQFMGERFRSRLAQDENEMTLDFVWALQNTDSYNRRALLEYHERYTSPRTPSEARPESQFGLGDIRRLLVAGIDGNVMPLYLHQLSNDQFKSLVMQDVAPALKETVNLMQSFEKVAKRGISKQDDLQGRIQIEQALGQAVSAPPVPPRMA